MRKLTHDEEHALAVLRRHTKGFLVDADDLTDPAWRKTKGVLDELVRKKRAVVEVTDGGVRYHAAS